MKVVLKAFQGRLFSEALDFPEETGHRISLFMDLDGRRWRNYDGKLELNEPSKTVRGIFECDNTYSLLSDNRKAKNYILIGIEEK